MIHKILSALTRRQKARVFVVLDCLLVPLALLFAFAVQQLPLSAVDRLLPFVPFLPYVLLGNAILSNWLGLPMVKLAAYDGHAVGRTAVVASFTAGLLAVTAMAAGLDLNTGTCIIFALCLFLLSAVSRVALHQLVQSIYRRAAPRCKVLIYGAGATGIQLAQALKANENIDPVAFIDDNSSLHGMTLVGLTVHSAARIEELARSRRIQRVLLAMPSQNRARQLDIIRQLQRMKLEVQALPSFAQLVGEDALVDKLAPIAPQAFLGRAAREMPLGDAADAYRGRTVLISGAGGSIGSELCRQVLESGAAKLVLFELSELALYTVHQELEPIAAEAGITLVPVLGSVTDSRQMRQTLARHRVQVVIHAAAYKHVPLVEANPLPGIANNVFGTHTLARAAAEAGIERFILISSDKAVRPTNVMGASKRLAEMVLQDLSSRSTGTIFTMVRFGNVLGSSGSVVPLFQQQVARGGPVTVTDVNVKRYFMTIQEAVQLVLTAAAGAQGGEVHVLDMGVPVPIAELARQVIESAGYTVRDAAHPDGDIEIKIIGLRPGEKMVEELTLTDTLTPTLHPKIFSAREEHISEIGLASVLRGLRQALAAGDEQAARDLLCGGVEGSGLSDQERQSL